MKRSIYTVHKKRKYVSDISKYTSSSSSVEVLDLNQAFGRETSRLQKNQDIGNSGQVQDLDSCCGTFAKQMTLPGWDVFVFVFVFVFCLYLYLYIYLYLYLYSYLYLYFEWLSYISSSSLNLGVLAVNDILDKLHVICPHRHLEAFSLILSERSNILWMNCFMISKDHWIFETNQSTKHPKDWLKLWFYLPVQY